MSGSRYPHVCLGLALVILLPAIVSAAIVTHEGDADPTTESPAWAKGGTLNGSPVNDGGTKAWKTQDSDTNYVSYRFTIPESTFNDPAGWTYRVRARVVSSPYDPTKYVGIGFWINEINHYFLFCLV
jgi:hypothetical protein